MQLLDKPLDKDFEDLVCACFSAAGYFVQAGISRDEDGKNVYEHDCVATKLINAVRHDLVVEAKSGGYQYGDALKLLGQMVVANLKEGVFVVAHEKDSRPLSVFRKVLDRHGMKFVQADSVAAMSAAIRDQFGDLFTDGQFLDVCRFSWKVQRALLQDVADHGKSPGGPELKAYRKSIVDELFFAGDAIGRATAVANQYKQVQQLASAMAWARKNGAFSVGVTGRCEFLSQAFIHGHYPEIQAAMYLEHLARLYMLFAGSEFRNGSDNPQDDEKFIAMMSLPSSFHAGRDWARTLGHLADVLPQLWQHYLFIWGGFHFTDERKKGDLSRIGKPLGLSDSDVERGLKAFDKFYPIGNNGWHKSQNLDSYAVLTLVPPCVRGVGVIARLRHGGLTAAKELGVDSDERTTFSGWYDRTKQYIERPLS